MAPKRFKNEFARVAAFQDKELSAFYDQRGELKRVELREEQGAPAAGSGIAAVIDHTLLKPDATEAQIKQICDEALQYGFASVCVNPFWVGYCAEALKGSGVKVASVIGFPLGANKTRTKVSEARRAIRDGAQELDMVLNIGALKSGYLADVARDINKVVRAAHPHGVIVKVIIETCLLSQEEKVNACLLAKAAGADFVKTSTGFSGPGATVEDVALMRSVVGDSMGVKASGGVRSYEDARKMVDAGASRIGASSGVRIVQEEAGESSSNPEPGGY